LTIDYERTKVEAENEEEMSGENVRVAKVKG